MNLREQVTTAIIDHRVLVDESGVPSKCNCGAGFSTPQDAARHIADAAILAMVRDDRNEDLRGALTKWLRDEFHPSDATLLMLLDDLLEIVMVPEVTVMSALAEALPSEFTFISGDREQWLKSARGVLSKMAAGGVCVTSAPQSE